jgi:plastocyanin
MPAFFRKPLLPAFALAAIAFVVGASAPAFAKDWTVTISNFAFTPAETDIAAGDTVTFVNGDDTIHSVVADDGSFHSDGLDTSDKAAFTFPKAGTIGYHCGLHPFMTGKIVVK